MNPRAEQYRTVALVIARARIGFGVAMLGGAGPIARIVTGRSSRDGRVGFRLAGSRDVALGLGASTSVRERTQDAEWVGMSAFVDGLDAAVLLFTPRLPRLGRAAGLLAAATAATGWLVARRLADERAGRGGLDESMLP